MRFLWRLAGISLGFEELRHPEGTGIERSRLRWFGHLIRIPPRCLPLEVVQACPTGQRPCGSPSTHWRNYISQQALERLGVLQEEQGSAFSEPKAWNTLLVLLSLGSNFGNVRDDGWMDGWIPVRVVFVLSRPNHRILCHYRLVFANSAKNNNGRVHLPFLIPAAIFTAQTWPHSSLWIPTSEVNGMHSKAHKIWKAQLHMHARLSQSFFHLTWKATKQPQQQIPCHEVVSNIFYTVADSNNKAVIFFSSSSNIYWRFTCWLPAGV